MRIAFCGKGGSGKTSLASLMIHFLTSHQHDVLAIDGDINQHLGAALGFNQAELSSIKKLGQNQDILQNFVRGTNTRIHDPSHIIESTPAGTGSGFTTRHARNPITETFMLKRDHLRFVAVGGHEEHDVGATCFHKFTGAEGIFLNHYLDTQDEYVIADMCAGADPFASSGLATRFDACVIVLEPTLKSVAVFHQALHYARPHNVTLIPVANKCMDEADVKFIEQQIGQVCTVTFPPLRALRDAEQGVTFDISKLDAAALASLEQLKSTFDKLPPRNWEHYQKVGKFFHEKAANGWASAMLGVDMMTQIDPDFRYESVIESYLEEKAAA